MPERTGNEFLSDEELIAEIKYQWSEYGHWEWELMQLPEGQAFTPANDYMGSDWQQHIDDLVKEAKKRGLELPDRAQYVSQFGAEDEDGS